MSEEKKDSLEVLWTPQQVSKYFMVSQLTIYRWIKNGKIKKVIYLGSKIRIPRSEVERIAGVKKEELRDELA